MLVLYSELSAVVCYATEPKAWNAGKFLPTPQTMVLYPLLLMPFVLHDNKTHQCFFHDEPRVHKTIVRFLRMFQHTILYASLKKTT